MVSEITLSKSIRSNLLSLQGTATLMNKSQEHLSTGLKVNSAVDDPSSFFTAASLNARAGDLSRVLDSVGNAVQTIKAADEGISAITKLVESAQASARSALQSAQSEKASAEGTGAAVAADANATVTGADISANAAALTGHADIATGNELKISVDGGTASTFEIVSSAAAGKAVSLDDLVGLINNDANLKGKIEAKNDGGKLTLTAKSADVKFEIDTASTDKLVTTLGLTEGTEYKGTNLIDGQAAGKGVTQGQKLEVTVGTGTAQSITFGTGAGEVDTLEELNTALGQLSDVTASVDNDGNISITASKLGENVTIGGSADVTQFGLEAKTYEGDGSNSESRESLRQTFNDLRTQIDQLSEDSSFNGVNLLSGDSLEVIFNEDSTSKLSVNGVKFSSSNDLKITEASEDDFQENSKIDTKLGELDTALDKLRTQAAVFGSKLSTVQVRQDFTKNLTNVLETGAANLVLADTNEEGANLLALQTRQQLSSTSLRMASQADQSVLRLF